MTEPRLAQVWVVEDNSRFREVLAQEINDADDMQCEHAFGSSEALLQALEEDQAPDVILMDVGLPGVSGIDAITSIKERAPETRILMLTMFDDQDRVFKALCAGASGYLLKSSHDDIGPCIRQALAGGLPFSPPIARLVLLYFTSLTTPQSAPPDYHLSAREKAILQLMGQGLLKKQIAASLYLSYHTVDDYLRSIYRKLHVNNKTAAVSKAIRERLL